MALPRINVFNEVKIIFVLLILSIVLQYNCKSYTTTASDFLTSFAQTQAAFYAIVIGFNSISIQLVSSNYSLSGSGKIFTKGLKRAGVLAGASIFFDLYLVLYIDQYPNCYHFAIIFSFILALLALYYIIKYTFDIIVISLNPTSLLEILNEKSEEEKESKVLERLREFAINSLKRKDHSSFEEAIKKVSEKIIKDIDEKKFEKNMEIIFDIGEEAAIYSDDESVSIIFSNLVTIYNKLDASKTKKYFTNDSRKINGLLKISIERGLEKSTICGFKFYEKLLDKSNSDTSVEYYKEYGILPPNEITYKLNILDSLISLCTISCEMKSVYLSEKSSKYIYDMIKRTLDVNNDINILNGVILDKIKTLGIIASENRQNNATTRIIMTLTRIARSPSTNGKRIRDISTIIYKIGEQSKYCCLESCYDQAFNGLVSISQSIQASKSKKNKQDIDKYVNSLLSDLNENVDRFT
ncbi:hypothetical protein [uncultured Methanolobus sp.]|uniref:hypothetical protein n=1 Tax=uncultured Methanolobus sp. TaxID=218300 RepID=UPI002AABEEBC|nr:hypothetical protein [uncultured Methanolobus sp.]